MEDQDTPELKVQNKYSMVKYVHRRIKNNKNFLVTITGPTGSGKSWTGLSIAELLDPTFNIDRVIFKGKELMRLINTGNLKPGSVILWDEAGIDLSNRNWQSVTNKMLNALLQTFRSRNFILIFTVPFSDFVDASSRKLFHADFETQRINKALQEVVIKPKLLQYNPNLKKWYRKYLKVSSNGKMIKIKRWAVPKPSDELIKVYEAKKVLFANDLNKDIGKQLEKLEGKEEPTAVEKVGKEVICDACNHKWLFTGKSLQPNCPSCNKKITKKNPYFATTTTGTRHQLNLSSSETNQEKINNNAVAVEVEQC
jgi:ABC-type oligopeptide transport system ATPase subunit